MPRGIKKPVVAEKVGPERAEPTLIKRRILRRRPIVMSPSQELKKATIAEEFLSESKKATEALLEAVNKLEIKLKSMLITESGSPYVGPPVTNKTYPPYFKEMHVTLSKTKEITAKVVDLTNRLPL